MASRTSYIATTKSKVIKTRDGTDVAARYFVYKIYEFYGRTAQPMGDLAWDGRVTGDRRAGG